MSTDTPLTKRQHALHELLSSERAYASDLALIRDVHIPLALGETAPLSGLPTPPTSNSSSRTQSTISDSSSTNVLPSSSSSNSLSSSSQQTGPPMNQEDVKIIFGNITEIALFSNLFCQALQDALGDLVNGGNQKDHVGALFLRIIPELEGPYKQYITRHPTALNHLQQLPQTSALTNYLTYTQNIASSLSHAWDLSSLLIKPVQRLLKYPLLLKAIIDETPDGHPDKENLLNARKQLEEVARNVNEGRRRAEVVRDVLTSKKKPIGVGVAAQVNLTKMKSIRVNPISSGGGSGGSIDGKKTPEEAILVEKLQKELKEIEEFAQKFAKNVVDWAKMTSNVVFGLRTWAVGFAKVIGLSAEQESEAFDAFLNVVEQQLMPLCVDLEAVINERVLKELAHLLMTMNQPLKLLSSMNDQEPYHYHLLNMEVSAKNRPPPTLLAASTNYLALRGQLATELPTYIKLFHRGLSIFVHRLTVIQIGFYCNVRDRWGDLWDMLRVEGEMNAGHKETIEVWKKRWNEMTQGLENLRICHRNHIKPHPRSHSHSRDQHYQESERGDERGDIRRDSQDIDYLTYIQQQEYLQTVHGLAHLQMSQSMSIGSTIHGGESIRTSSQSKYSPNPSSSTAASTIYSMMGSVESPRSPNFSGGKEKDKKKSKHTQVSSVMSMLDALESSISSSAVGSVGPFVSPPYPVSSRSTGFSSSSGSGNSGGGSGGKGLNRRGSTESFMSRGTARSPPSTRTIQPHQHPHAQRRRTTGPVPSAEDYVEYGMILREKERERERERVYGHHHHLTNGYYPYGQGMPGLPRMKSMPLPHHPHGLGGEWEYADSEYGGDLFYQSTGAYDDDEHLNHAREREEYEAQERTREQERLAREQKEREGAREKEREREKEKDKRESRGRREPSSQRPVVAEDNKKRYSEHSQTSQKSKEEKDRSTSNTNTRKRSGSIKSITSFFTGTNNNRDSTHSEASRIRTRSHTPDQSHQQHLKSHSPNTPSPRDSWAFKPAKYLCRVIHPCKPPTTGPASSPSPLSYFSFPFFTLVEDDVYEVLQEAGHPSLHPRLPLIVDDGEDCLLLCRAHDGEVGWALASFLEPFT